MGDLTEKEGGQKSRDTKLGLTLRVVVAAYVLYLAFQLIQGFGEASGNRVLLAAAIVIFVAAGGAILIFSLKKLIRKEYIDAEEGADDEER